MSNVFVIIHYCHGSKAIWWCAADSHKRMPFTTDEDGIGRFEMPGNKLVAWLQTSVMTSAHWAGSWRVVPFPRERFQPLTFLIWFRGASRKPRGTQKTIHPRVNTFKVDKSWQSIENFCGMRLCFITTQTTPSVSASAPALPRIQVWIILRLSMLPHTSQPLQSPASLCWIHSTLNASPEVRESRKGKRSPCTWAGGEHCFMSCILLENRSTAVFWQCYEDTVWVCVVCLCLCAFLLMCTEGRWTIITYNNNFHNYGRRTQGNWLLGLLNHQTKVYSLRWCLVFLVIIHHMREDF